MQNMVTRAWIFRYASFLLLLFCIACNSHRQPKDTPASPSSAEQAKTVQPQPSQPQQASQQQAAVQQPTHQQQKSISYAKNPERFVKMPTEEPPFNITNPKTAQEHFNVAVNDDHHNQIDKAIEEYQQALQLQPDWAVAHFRLAVDYQKQGRADEAIAHWELATRYSPQFYAAYDQLSAAYERQGNLKKAIEAYSALLNYPPARMPAHYQIGIWYAQLGERSKAKEHLETYRELALKSKSEELQSDRFQKASQELQKLNR
jgi:tetratricopeptide (TPR) repeat protein